MNTTRLAFASALILLGFVASETALAGPHGGRGYYGHRGGVRLSVGVGFPIGFGYGYYGGYYGGYYPSPYYSPYYAPYYPPVATVPYAAPAYIEQGGLQVDPGPAPSQAFPGAQNFWYYCAESKAYYPYVNQCPGGWQRVSPTPPSG